MTDLQYANRPLERGFDPYQSLREHLAKLNASVKGRGVTAGKHDLVIEQGATFRTVLTWYAKGKPVNLAGYTARMQVRPTASNPTVVLSLTTENSGITLANGTITLSLTATQTAALTPGGGVYDLELVNGPTVTRLIEGPVAITPEVTR